MKYLLPDRLTELLNENGTSKRELAKKINVAPSAITYWTQKGETHREPTATNIIKLADYFNVCADYILGRQDWY